MALNCSKLLNFSVRTKTSIACVFTLIAIYGGYASADEKADEKAAQSCRRTLASVEDSTRSTATADLDAKGVTRETYTLDDLVDADPSKNLAVQHPSVVLNSAQRVASWIRSSPSERVVDPSIGGGYVNLFPVLSKGLPINEGRHIIGQFDAIQTFVDYVEAAARGDGSMVKTPVFVGPAGTGKTEYLEVLRRVGRNLSLNNPDQFMYTYEWENLKDIPALFAILNMQPTAAGNLLEHPLRCPLNHSPLVLLPPGLQKAVIMEASARASQISGVEPTPNQKPCPHCQYIRESVINHYAQGKAHLTDNEILEALKKHIKIKRFIVGIHGAEATIDAQGKDVDYGGLFFSLNPFQSTQFGPGHPMSYFLNGKVLRADGGILTFDEFFRNDESLRDATLRVQESRVVSRGGAPDVDLDALIIAASNDESIVKAKGNGTAKAQLDRTRLIPMRLDTHPNMIAKTMLLMKGIKTILVRKLGLETPEVEQPLEKADLEELFPLSKTAGNPMLNTDRRYGVYINVGRGAEPVHIAPHSLMAIAMTVAASRMNTDVATATDLGGHYSVINDGVFTDPTQRIKAQMGELPLNAAQQRELRELALLLKEGSTGISQRDAANVWLTQAINEARRPENHNCVTPALVKKVFIRLLAQGELKPPSNEMRLHWLKYIDSIFTSLLVPKVTEDVMTAVGSSTASINSVYRDVFEELYALSNDDTATEYTTRSGETRLIDIPRLNEIRLIYYQTEKRNLAVQEIINFHSTYGATNSEERQHNGLANAIKRYFASKAMAMASLGDMVRYGTSGEGSTEVRSRFSDVANAMRGQLGYCPRCTHAAMELAQQSERQRK